MKKTKFTEQQIVFALKQAETGTRVDEVCRKMGISEATFYNWKKKYGGLGLSELRLLKQLQEENTKLKQLVADLSLDKQMLQDVLKKILEESSITAIGYVPDRILPCFDPQSLFSGADASFQLALQAASPGGSSAEAKN
jgi:putative transposase